MEHLRRFLGGPYRMPEGEGEGAGTGEGEGTGEGTGEGEGTGTGEGEGMLSQAGGWDHAEGVPGEGDRPEWLGTKFKSVASQAEAYGELEKKIGTFGANFGAPDGDYELTAPANLPEGTTWEFDKEDPMLVSFTKAAKEVGLSQAGFDKVVHNYISDNSDMVISHDQQVAQVVRDLGENGEQVMKDTWDRLSQVLPEDQANALDGVVTSALAVQALQTLLTSEAILPADGGGPPGAITREDLRAMRAKTYPDDHPKKGQRMYGLDEEYTKKVDALYSKQFPGQDVSTV